jgi:Tfp pilus assembly protein PilN
MKEIDFLPDWYKESRRKKAAHHKQYTIIFVLFAAMVVWAFSASYTLNSANAKLKRAEQTIKQNQKITDEYDKRKQELEQLEEKRKIINQLDDHINIPAVFAELSHIIHQDAVLARLLIDTEKYEPNQKKSKSKIVAAGSNKKSDDKQKDYYRFRITITGLCNDAADVAALISNLEDSAYFCQIVPGFSRNKTVKTSIKDREKVMTEFDISFYLANYEQNSKEKQQ